MVFLMPRKTRKITKERSIIISMHMPKKMIEELDALVEKGIMPSRSEAIRYAVVFLLNNLNPLQSTLQNIQSTLQSQEETIDES
jgi:Arc/MetJ-type ribon-helix-helix transcriptional regulator